MTVDKMIVRSGIMTHNELPKSPRDTKLRLYTVHPDSGARAGPAGPELAARPRGAPRERQRAEQRAGGRVPVAAALRRRETIYAADCSTL